MPGPCGLLLICFMGLFVTAAVAQGADLALERNLRKNLAASRSLLAKMERAAASGASNPALVTELMEFGEAIRADHQVLLGQLKAREAQLVTFGPAAVSRQREVRERYEQSLSLYLDHLGGLKEDQPGLGDIRRLRDILAEILPRRTHRLHGSIPYRRLHLPARAPVFSPEIVPSYRGGDRAFNGADLAASPEAQISPAIAGLAASLHWSPVEMYEWVKNNIRTEWYWGAMKGAEETLRQRSGNDADQAALLIALFRSAGFPARFVRGVVEFFPDIDAAVDQTGIADPRTIAGLFQKAGIPYETVIAGGGIANFRFEHIWAEVEIPHANYRGAVLDEHGRTWLALDTSVKTAGSGSESPADVLQTLDLTDIRRRYLEDWKPETPLEFLAAGINEQLAGSGLDLSYDDLLHTRTINRENMQILPASLQFREIAVTGEYASLPGDFIHKARFIARTNGGMVLFDQAVPLHMLSNRSVAVTFEPETIEDQEVINAHGGLDNTPLYLIRLRPLITVDGKREIVGRGGLAAGTDFSLTVELSAPAVTERVENILVAGYPAVIGLAAQQAVVPDGLSQRPENAERLLFERAMSFIDRGNKAEEELASLLRTEVVRPLPTMVSLGGVLDVISLLDAPHGFAFKGVYLDADLRVVEPVEGVAPAGWDPAPLFMQLASLQNSVLENRVFEEGLGVDAVSTAKLLALAGRDAFPVAVVDAGNIGAVLPELGLPAIIQDDIANAVHRGYLVTVPEGELFYEDWSGFAYIKEDPASFESGWMLSGTIAGGMTALNPDRWPDEYYDILANPMVESSENPLGAVQIKVISGLDISAGTAGRQLPEGLQVVALDRQGNRVRGVEVVFEVRAGGGRLSRRNAADWSDRVMALTGYDGIARVDVLLAESTGVNPATARRATDQAVQPVDETVIEVTTTTGLRTAAPLSVYGFPDVPHHLRVEGGGGSGAILSWAATLVAHVEDRYGNRINGEAVDFLMGDARMQSSCPSSNNDSRPGLLVQADAPCMNTIPVHGECGGDSVTGLTGLHTGAVAQVLLGGLPGAAYPVTVTSGSLTPEVVTITSFPAGVCDDDDPPYSALVLKVIHETDSFGHVISGGAVSTTVPLLARMYYVREREKVVDRDMQCTPDETDTCPVVLGTGEFYTDTDFVSASVRFDGFEAASLGNGLFRIDYPLSPTARQHDVRLVGEATETVRITADICDRTNDCRLIDFEKAGPAAEHGTVVYAVDVTVPRETHCIPVNEKGYVTYDYPIAYAIEPPAYTASTAYFVLEKEVDPGVYREAAYLGAGTSGQDEITFLRGFRFDGDTAYRARVILNKGSSHMEVQSREMLLTPLTIELDADLNGDGMFLEDDPQESMAPGLVVPLNFDDDDNDGVPDNIDGYDADGIAGNRDDAMAFVDADGNMQPVDDDDLIEVKLTGLPGDLAEGTVILEIPRGAEKIRIWTDRAKTAGSLLLDGTAWPDGGARSWVLGSDAASLSDLPASLFIEGVEASLSSDDAAILVSTYRPLSEPEREVETDRLWITVLVSAIVPDYNRDGRIDDRDRGRVARHKPWRFWVNDDNDGSADPEGIAGSNADLPGQGRDNSDNQVNGVRDLIDFFPLHLDIGAALSFWPPADGYEYIVKAVPDSGMSNPGLAMIEGLTENHVLSADDCALYLEDPATASEFAAKTAMVLTAEGTRLTAGFLEQLRSSARNTIILLEGREPWKGEIALEIRRQGTFVHSVALPVEIVEIEEMFGHKNLRPIAGAADGTPDRYTVVDPSSGKILVGENHEIGRQPFCMQGEDRTLVWVHGYNVGPGEARATFAEVFKRFFHAGLNGRFYGVSWFGDPPALITPHYHQAVVNAFATAGAFRDFAASLPGATSIAAHSLGNMVAGSAIQDHGLTDFARYFAVNAAVALEAYGQVTDIAAMVNPDGSFADDPNADMIRVETWPDYLAAGQSRLLASEWHTLFASPDNRSRLTWRNRLDTVPSDRVYNFYSSTEEVLRRYAGDNLVFTGNGLSVDALAVSAWVKQEKFKGRRKILNLADNIGGVSSPFAGWSLNPAWWIENPESMFDPKELMPLPPASAAEITSDQLRGVPFFDPAIGELVADDPEGSRPSDFVAKKVSETVLSDYYRKNTPAHNLLQVRDWLLAEAFPATTLPMGANRYDLLESNNIDISGVRNDSGGCCKTSEKQWPRAQTVAFPVKEWRHSDYKEMSYQHVYEFYQKIKITTEN